MWGLFEKVNPAQLIGCVHLWRQGKPENRGFWLGRPFWGKGCYPSLGSLIPFKYFVFDVKANDAA